MQYQEKIEKIASELASAERVLFITGAGISAESGLPTYRGIGGLYEEKSTELGLPIEVVLSGQMLGEDPETTWRFISQIEKSCRDAKFNQAHEIISNFEKKLPHVCVLTQNVDGFHRAAGSDNVIEIHGDVHDIECTDCSYSTRVENYAKLQNLPMCPECGAVLRPKVVLFGEMLPVEKITSLSTELDQGFDIVFSIGTTSVFPYIAEPVYRAKDRGNLTIEINPTSTSVSQLVDIKISQGAKQTLIDIENLFEPR